jgi:hypothetical protein
MKKFFTIIILLTAAIHCRGQDPDWLWAKSGGGSDNDIPNSVCTDPAGNVYITGYFLSPSVTFGSNVLFNSNSLGGEDIFFLKYDMNGNILWAKSFGEQWADKGYACAADADGFVYLMGEFTGDTLVLDTDTLFGRSPFLAKFDSSGNEIWARTKDPGFGNGNRANGMCVDSMGHIFVTGFYIDSISFGGHVLHGSHNGDMFLVKYDSTGNVLWALTTGNTNNYSIPIACASDGNGNIFVTGKCFGSYMYVGTDTLIVNGGNVFLLKYDSLGNFLWAKSASGGGAFVPYSIATDSTGNVFICGSFMGDSIIFGTTVLINPSPSFKHTYIAGYDSSGNVVWACSPDAGWDEGVGLATDRSGNIYMTGYFLSDHITFGTITLSRVPQFDADLYVVKFDAGGNAIWAKRVGNPYIDEVGFNIAIDLNSDIYLAGYFADTATLSFGNSNLITNGLADVFLAKLTYAVGEEEIISPAAFTVFPNPSEGQINIRYSVEIDEIKISNLLGQVIYHTKHKEEYLPLQINESGIYFVSVKTGTKAFTKKLIVNY